MRQRQNRATPGTLPTTCSRWFRIIPRINKRLCRCKTKNRMRQLIRLKKFCMEISGGYGPNRQSRAFWGYIKSRTKNKTEKDMVHFKTGVCVNNSIREAIERFSNG